MSTVNTACCGNSRSGVDTPNTSSRGPRPPSHLSAHNPDFPLLFLQIIPLFPLLRVPERAAPRAPARSREAGAPRGAPSTRGGRGPAGVLGALVGYENERGKKENGEKKQRRRRRRDNKKKEEEEEEEARFLLPGGLSDASLQELKIGPLCSG